MKKEIFKIKGMHCASCAMIIEKAVSKLPGIKVAQVNFAAETLLAEFDENQVSPKDLKEAVSSVGYKLTVPNEVFSTIIPSVSEGSHQKIFEVGGKPAQILPNGALEGKEFLALKVIGMDSPHCAMIIE